MDGAGGEKDPVSPRRDVEEPRAVDVGLQIPLTVGELFELIRDEMPQDAPGTLSAEQTASLVAYLLHGNRLPAGEMSLPADVEQLRQIAFDQ